MPEIVHVHNSAPFTVYMAVGRLIFRHSWRYHAGAKVPGPDLNQGHINHINGNTVMVNPVPGDELQPNINLEAETIKPTIDSGQQGRSIRDTSTPIIKLVEPASSSDNTARIWRRGKVFNGKIKF
jgi:hypothetical protein